MDRMKGSRRVANISSDNHAYLWQLQGRLLREANPADDADVVAEQEREGGGYDHAEDHERLNECHRRLACSDAANTALARLLTSLG